MQCKSHIRKAMKDALDSAYPIIEKALNETDAAVTYLDQAQVNAAMGTAVHVAQLLEQATAAVKAALTLNQLKSREIL